MYVFGSGGVGGEWVRGLGFSFTNPVGTGGGGVGRVSVFGLRWFGLCRLVVGMWLGPGSRGVVLCLCECAQRSILMNLINI